MTLFLCSIVTICQISHSIWILILSGHEAIIWLSSSVKAIWLISYLIQSRILTTSRHSIGVLWTSLQAPILILKSGIFRVFRKLLDSGLIVDIVIRFGHPHFNIVSRSLARPISPRLHRANIPSRNNRDFTAFSLDFGSRRNCPRIGTIGWESIIGRIVFSGYDAIIPVKSTIAVI